MVLYGYGLDMNEQDEMEEKSFLSAWQGEKGRIARTVKTNDREKMIQYFEKAQDRLKVFYNPHNFIDEIAWRIYTEACMNPEEKFNPDTYNGEAFEKYVQDEMYYNGRGRDEILEAIVKRTFDFFIGNRGIFKSFAMNKDNLRTSLVLYLTS